MFFAPVFGYLGDRFSRKLVMIFGITIWSVTVFVSSYMGPHVSWKSFIEFISSICRKFNFIYFNFIIKKSNCRCTCPLFFFLFYGKNGNFVL